MRTDETFLLLVVFVDNRGGKSLSKRTADAKSVGYSELFILAKKDLLQVRVCVCEKLMRPNQSLGLSNEMI